MVSRCLGLPVETEARCLYALQDVGDGRANVWLAPLLGLLIAEVTVAGPVPDYHGGIDVQQPGARVHWAGAVGQGQDYFQVPWVLCGAGDSDGRRWSGPDS